LNPFSKLGLSPQVIEVLEKLGFEQPTPIQEQAIPMLLGNNPTDFIGLAQTGTGKTAAFGLPLVELIDTDNRNIQALIMAPTRELGQQTAKQLVSFASNDRKLNVECVYGGANISAQIKAMKGPVQILVATPGRLLDLMKRKAVRLDDVRYVVLDEADEMLNMGFKEDIDEILEHTPEQRVTWLFSATMPKEIRRIVKKYMEAPLEVHINAEQKTNENISHAYVVTKASNKIPALRRFLDVQPDMRGILFCRTRRETQQIADDLGDMGYSVEALHGELSQGQRDAVMKRFKTRSMQMLIATDVAARGIDVNDLTHVLHHTLPDQLESYTHRSGRTGRAGKTGISLVFINSREGRKLSELEKKIGVTFERVEVPNIDEIQDMRMERWAQQLIKTPIDERSGGIMEIVKEKFEALSKEDLMLRLISSQLEQLIGSGGHGGDLNEHPGASSRGERKAAKPNRFFINVGSMDGLDRNDILYFLSDISGVNRKYFTDLSLQKNCTFFDVDMGHVPGFETRFDGIEVDGRAIRVNKDDDDTRSEKPRGAYSKGRGGSNGGGGYSKGGSSHGDGRSSGPSQRRNSNSGASNRPRGAKDGASSRGKKKSY